jgi:hypothetical protein
VLLRLLLTCQLEMDVIAEQSVIFFFQRRIQKSGGDGTTGGSLSTGSGEKLDCKWAAPSAPIDSTYLQ